MVGATHAHTQSAAGTMMGVLEKSVGVVRIGNAQDIIMWCHLGDKGKPQEQA